MQDDTANQTPSPAPLDSSLPPQESMPSAPMDTTMPTPPPFEPVTNPVSPVVEPMATVPPMTDQPTAAPEAVQDTGGGFPQVLDGSETPPPPPVINGGTTPTTPTFVPEKSGGKGRGKIVATIFGILVLVGGVGAGVLAIRTQVLTRPRADACVECTANGCPAGQQCNNVGPTFYCPDGHFVCQWSSAPTNPPPTTPPTSPTNPPSGGFTCDGLTGTHCNTALGCHQFTCVGQNNWRDDGPGGVCCSQAACSSNAACTTTPTTPPGTGASCAGGTPDQQFACRTLTGQPGLGCVKCNNGLFVDVEDSTWGCPSQCYTGSQNPDTTPPPDAPTEDQYGTACQNGCCNLSTNGISNFPACAHNCWVVAYKCPGASAGIPCNSNGSVGDGQCFQANYCGSQQIDVRCESFDNTGDCAGLAGGSAISVVSIINPGACVAATPTPPGQTNPPGDNPTPTPPGPSAQCLEVKAWDTDWNQLTAAQLSALSAGDVVRFTVKGGASSGTFDMARFTINTVVGSDVTTTKPTTGEFYYEYTIPAGVTSFTIKGEIHHVSLGWR